MLYTKKIFNRLFASIAIGFILTIAQAPALALELGDSAPKIVLLGKSGNIDLADLKGKVVYLDFWASWCAPCKQSFPWMNDLQSRYRDAGLKVVAINLDANAADADRFLAATPTNFIIAYDPKAENAQRYQVKGMPSSYLIDREGKIQLVHMGFNQAARDKLEAAISSTLKAQP